MKPLITLVLDDDEDNVLVVSSSHKTILHREPVLLDIDGHEAAVKTAAIEAIRVML